MDMPRLFPIGEVAKLFNLSVSSLRHYDGYYGGKSAAAALCLPELSVFRF